MFLSNGNTTKKQKRDDKGSSLKETHQTTNRTGVISIQPQRVVEGEKARDECVGDNLPERSVVHNSVCLFDRVSGTDPISPQNNTGQQLVRVPNQQTNDQRLCSHTATPCQGRTQPSRPQSSLRRTDGLKFAAVWLFAVSRPPRVRVNAPDNGDPRRGVCGSRVRDLAVDRCVRSLCFSGLMFVPADGCSV